MTASAPPVIEGVALVICPAPNASASVEFRFGWEALKRCFADTTRFADEQPSAQRLHFLVEGLPNSAFVVLMPHAQTVVTAAAVGRLCTALNTHPGLTAALAHDQRFTSQPPPDYCTSRGLERYLNRLDTQPVKLTPFLEQAIPLVVLTTAGHIRGGQVWSQAAWVGNSHVHDYSDYHQATRDEVIPLVPPHARRVLDVGGGEGRYLRRLQQTRAGMTPVETHLAEISAAACEAAREQVEQVWQGDFSTLPIEVRFDCITFLEALEHAADPVHWLLRARDLLAPGGAVVASVPNVGHWSVVADLLEGRWDYSPVGIHCVTHLRFFTERTLRDLFESAGLCVARIERISIPCPTHWRNAWSDAAAAGAGLATDSQSWDTYAFIVQAFAEPQSVQGADAYNPSQGTVA